MQLEIEKKSQSHKCVKEQVFQKDLLAMLKTITPHHPLIRCKPLPSYLEIPLPYLLLEKKQHLRVVRKDNRTMTTFNQLKIEHISSMGGLSLRSVEFPPGASIGDAHAHEGEECHLVLEGKVLAEQGEDSVILEEGDSFSWNASVPHTVKNIGDCKAVVVIAVYSDTVISDL